jgi:hypothetical protein
MKTFTLLALCTLSVIFTQAQTIQKNKKILGGSLSFDFSRYDEDTLSESSSSGFTFIPSYGKAIKNNLVFGFGLILGLHHGETETTNVHSESDDYRAGAHVFLEKFFPLRKSFSFSANANLGGYWASDKYKAKNTVMVTETTQELQGYNIGLYASPAINYALNEKFILQFFWNDFLRLDYYHSTTEITASNTPKTEKTTSGMVFGTSLNQPKALSNLSFALRYIF